MFNLFKTRKPMKDHVEELISILERVQELCSQSKDSLWSPDSANDLSEYMISAIQSLRKGKRISLKRLDFLFLPTGSLQDISIDNGWGDEFLELSERFDRLKEIWYQRSAGSDSPKAATQE